jgi:ParB family chromosome partitioning protein
MKRMESIMAIKIKDLKVSPFNVRNVSDLISQNLKTEWLEGISTLAEDIKEKGLLQPIILNKGEDGTYEIFAGSRRAKALEEVYGSDYTLKKEEFILKSGLTNLEMFSISLSENQQRMDLTPLELCNAAKKLADFIPDLDEKELAKRLGIPVTRLKRIINLEQDIEKGRVPEKALIELSKKDAEKPQFTDKHWEEVRETKDQDVIEEATSEIIDREVEPKDVDRVVEKVKKEKRQDYVEPKDPSSSDEDLDTKIEYKHKGVLKLAEEGGKLKLFCIDPKMGEEKIDLKAYLEYLKNPGKFIVEANIRLKIIPKAL